MYGVLNAFHRDSRIVYCYELVAQMENDIASTNVLPGFRREDALVGGFVSTMLHETGHAIFYLLEIPIFGREEDAADAIASYVALQFGDADRAPDHDRHGFRLARPGAGAATGPAHPPV